jgi:DNA polymerase V
MAATSKPMDSRTKASRALTSVLNSPACTSPSAARLLQPLWRDGYRDAKAGVILNDLVPAGKQQRLIPTRDPKASRQVMIVLDAVNAVHGWRTLRIAATGVAQTWATRQQRLSQRDTTRLQDIMQAKAF